MYVSLAPLNHGESLVPCMNHDLEKCPIQKDCGTLMTSVTILRPHPEYFLQQNTRMDDGRLESQRVDEGGADDRLDVLDHAADRT